ncbi:hypothetical protein F2Q68_00021365 [Brassica cretica]|uniref:Uncharacterized protein n=2 Tax=Brassica cretica TaxID=69181 RepID=A0A3N6RT51_BRACR|nr:hypothetical protein F2Q68_00021365 [Brassica cretica]KAF3565688.1 hypothetical protein DY000_02016565 [Brassica cretica]
MMSWTTRVKPSRMILDPFRVVGPLRTMGNSGRLTITEVVSRYGGEVLVMFELHGLMGCSLVDVLLRRSCSCFIPP